MKTTLKPLAIAFLVSLIVACGADQETPTSSIQKSRQFLDAGEHASAKIVLQTAIQNSPSDAALRYELARVHYAMGDFLGAEKELLKAGQLGIAASQTQPLLASTLYRQLRFEDVIALEGEIAEGLTPEASATVFSMIGRSFLPLLDTGAAQLRLDVALDRDSRSANAMVGMAALNIMENRAQEALTWAEKARNVDAEFADGWYALAVAHRRLSQPEEAIEALGKTIDLRPYIDLVYAERALLLIEQEQYFAAELDIKALSLSSYKNFWFTHYIRGRLQLARGEYQDAVNSFNEVLEQTSTHAETKFYAAIAQSKLGNYEQARLLASQAVAKLPGRAGPRGLLADLMIHIGGEKEQGYRILEELIAADPGNTTALEVLGIAYAGAGNYEKAIPVLEKLLVIAPDNSEAQQLLMIARIQSGAEIEVVEGELGQLSSQYEKDLWLAFTHLNRGDIAEAQKQAIELRANYPDEIDPLKLLAITYMLGKDWENARPVFQEVVERTDGALEAMRHMVVLEMAAGNSRGAKKALKALLNRHGESSPAVLFAVVQYNKLGDTDRAEEILEKAFAKKPSDLALRSTLAAHRFKLEDYDGAIDLVQGVDATTLDGSATLLELYGMALERSGQYELALAQFQQLVRVNPDSAASELLTAELLQKLGRMQAAKSAYERAAEIAPDNPYVTTRQITFLTSIQQFDQARKILARMQGAQGETAELLKLEGKLDYFEGDVVAASETLKKAYVISPDAGTAIWLSRALVLQMKFDEALQALDSWLEEHPEEHFVLMEKAGVFLSQNKEKEALVVYQEVARIQPENIPALNNIAWLSRDSDLVYALKIANRANRTQPNNPTVLDTLGYLELKAGDRKSALSHLQLANKLAPEAQEIKLNLARALSENNEKDKARRLLREVIDGTSQKSLKKQAQQQLESLAG